MRPEVSSALLRHTELRHQLLSSLALEDRKLLLELIFSDFFVDQRRALLRWSTLTGQTAQIDTGYIAQHIASVLTGVPGQGFKGKGFDLVDGSEVKSAAILSGVDRPRWNHDLGTVSSDADRVRRGLTPKSAVYLAAPRLVYVLFDREVTELGRLRVRAWLIDAQADKAWRDLVIRFVQQRTPAQYNMQLHPPVGYDDDIVVNTLGNLDFANAKVFEARFVAPEEPGENLDLEWVLPPRDVRDLGRTISVEYGGRGARPSRLEGESSLAEPTRAVVEELFPDIPGLKNHSPTKAAKPS